MARVLMCLAVACAAASCATRGDADDPAWLDERIAEADAAAAGYPPLSDFPTDVPQASSMAEWRKGLSDMAAVRDDVLSDPALDDPGPAGVDAAELARRSREEMMRDLRGPRVDDASADDPEADDPEADADDRGVE